MPCNGFKINNLWGFIKVNSLMEILLFTFSVGNYGVRKSKARNYINLVGGCFLLISCGSYGLDFGIVAYTFPIKEQDFLLMMSSRAGAIPPEQMAEHNRKIVKKMRAKVNRPTPRYLPKADRYKRWNFDPRHVLEADIVDCRGQVVYPKGFVINPMNNHIKNVHLSEPLLFFDGDDLEQVAWAEKQTGKLILVKGAPLKLGRDIDRRVYFDQESVYVNHFNIEKVPSKLSQVGFDLIIEEFVV